jgi:prolipoprotein diacylglyceryltransferase
VGVPIPALIVFVAVSLFSVAAGLVCLLKPRSVIRFTVENFPNMDMSASEGCLVLQVRIVGVLFIFWGLFLLLTVATALRKAR